MDDFVWHQALHYSGACQAALLLYTAFYRMNVLSWRSMSMIRCGQCPGLSFGRHDYCVEAHIAANPSDRVVTVKAAKMHL